MTNWKEGGPRHAKGSKGKKKTEKKDKAAASKTEKAEKTQTGKAEKRERSPAEKQGRREKSPATEKGPSNTGRREKSPATETGPVNTDRSPGEKRWKKVGHAQHAVSELANKINTDDAGKEPEVDNSGDVNEGQETNTPDPDRQAAVSESKENDAEPQSTKTEPNKSVAKADAVPGELKKEEPQVEDEDPSILLRNKILETIKNGFSIAQSEEGEIQITVDNVYPLLKALGLNPQNESVMDMVRDACMESSGDIQPSHFDEVTQSLVKIQDDELWRERLAEKARDALKESSEKAKAEAERIKKREQGIAEEEEEEESWEEMERKAVMKAKEKEIERQTDELYDNMKMAFRFIDSDEDGVISVKDVYNLMMGLGEMLDDDELWGMVTMADVDCDGKLTFKDFKRFLLKGTPDEIKSEDEEDDGLKKPKPTADVEDPITDDALVADKVDKEAPEPTADKTADEKPEPPKKYVVEEPKEDASAKEKRRKSLMYGYKMTSSNVAEKKEEKPIEEIKETTEGRNEVKETSDQTADDGAQDESNGLNAIKEEDEHSNYGSTEDVSAAPGNEQKTSTFVEGKRRFFSRHSSSASLRNKPNSIITNSDSTIEDSGLGTLDTNIDCSEIREVPDVFDISDDESELRNLTSSRGSKSKDDLEEDEDKIDEECVRESLSRFSNVSEQESEDSDEGVVDRSGIKPNLSRRRDEFSNEFMYYELERTPTEQEIAQKISEQMQTGIRFTRAELLTNAILKRSNTVPALIRYVPKPPSTQKTNLNGIKCSHIDIDLRCEMQPKANIKSLRKFSDRVQSARTRPKSAFFDRPSLERKMSIVDMSKTLTDDTFNSDSDIKRHHRPLTAPKSPLHRRHPARAWENDGDTPRPRRSRSAIPNINRREHSGSPIPRQAPRPQTSNLTYSSPLRTVPDLSCAKLQKMGDFTVVTSEPFAKSDQLYPRKSLLTSYHHGFKSIWPIGRNINVLQNKRPFESFEMNSYSRAVEREEFPFRGDIGTDNKENDPKPTPRSTKTIKLELNTDHIVRPKLKRLPSLLPCNFTPRTVR